jgi:hypothetical protein
MRLNKKRQLSVLCKCIYLLQEEIFILSPFDCFVLIPCTTEQWLAYHCWYTYHSLRNPVVLYTRICPMLSGSLSSRHGLSSGRDENVLNKCSVDSRQGMVLQSGVWRGLTTPRCERKTRYETCWRYVINMAIFLLRNFKNDISEAEYYQMKPYILVR